MDNFKDKLFSITSLLYLVILLVPASFFYTYHTVSSLDEDAKAIYVSSTLSANMAAASTQNLPDSNYMEPLSKWVNDNASSRYYVGGRSLQRDYALLQQCVQELQKNRLDPEKKERCFEEANTFAQVVQKMVYLKHNSVMNSFYISILLAMASILIAIFLMRLYIDRQIAKHTIYDNDTGRYNKRFFDVELPKALARSKRHDYPFSLIFVKVDTDDKNALHVIGDLLANTVRSGDIVCRYESNTFALLLPFTGTAGASILQSRISKKCEENRLSISCDYHTLEYDKDLMSPEEFIQKITQI